MTDPSPDGNLPAMALTYKSAGVDIDAGASLIEQIKPLVASTSRPEILGGIGGFAGLCRLPERYRDPVLVSGTDGVGTKLKNAFATGRHRGVGIDLVAMAVNDVVVIGAEPLFFLDYFATAKLEIAVAREVIAGIADGCRQAGCALIGGETAELPGLYHGSDYDLAGFCVGVVERDDIRDGQTIAPGDQVIGIPSSGLHSNGHSLARKALLEVLGLGFEDTPAVLAGASVADVLLEPTRIYVRDLLGLASAGVQFKGAAHITGGGLIENAPRMLPESVALRLDASTWTVPPVFDLVASAGVELAEMRRTFNMGIGMVVACAPAEVDAAIGAIPGARVIGEVISREGPPVTFA
ncbi:MAG TPA: phosphoribosylformylglycinamidine cyclo-ligase [Kofleriaceae bacterium]|nr:phosphoribosylformylglycinamidine cyclo-ligase [Kofleriaceae bacterium]